MPVRLRLERPGLPLEASVIALLSRASIALLGLAVSISLTALCVSLLVGGLWMVLP